MNTVRTSIVQVQISPNGDRHAPYVSALVRPFSASIKILPGYIADPTDEAPEMTFTHSGQIFSLIDALRVMGETLKEAEVAAAASSHVAPMKSDPTPA